MQGQNFAQFVASQQALTHEAAEDPPVDFSAIREAWLKDLDSLYSQILTFVAEFTATGSIRHTFTEVILTEEDLGSYPVKRLELGIGRQHVLIEPIGTLLIGCRGRVDVVGSAGRAQLMLVNDNAQSAADLIAVKVSANGAALLQPNPSPRTISWTWKIVSREHRGRFVEFDREAFSALLMEVMGA